MCDCLICQKNKIIEKIKQRGDIKEMQDLISSLQYDVAILMDDNARYDAIFKGIWPNSEKYLIGALKKIRNKNLVNNTFQNNFLPFRTKPKKLRIHE